MATGTVSSVTRDNWQLVASSTISSSTASVTISSLAGYKTYMVVGRQMLGTGVMWCRPNNDSTSGNYFNDNTALTMGAGMSTTTAEGSYIVIYNANESVPHLAEFGAAGSVSTYLPQFWLNPTPVTSLVLVTSGGANFTGGTIEVYGIAA